MPAVKNHQLPRLAKPQAVTPGPVAQAAQGAPPARGRPSWSGLLRLSLVSVLVKAYPVVTRQRREVVGSVQGASCSRCKRLTLAGLPGL
jgi:hypothetical protein